MKADQMATELSSLLLIPRVYTLDAQKLRLPPKDLIILQALHRRR